MGFYYLPDLTTPIPFGTHFTSKNMFSCFLGGQWDCGAGYSGRLPEQTDRSVYRLARYIICTVLVHRLTYHIMFSC